jgi:hypothetical protein
MSWQKSEPKYSLVHFPDYNEYASTVMDIYKYVCDSERYDCVSPAREEDGLAENATLDFHDGKSRREAWTPVPVVIDSDHNNPGDFPSLYSCTPVFSERAWIALCPLIGRVVEALPLICPGDQPYFAINALDIVDCLDLAHTTLSRNEISGNITDVRDHHFKIERLEGKHFFKTPQTKALEVLVSDEFRRIVESHGLKGLLFKKVW